MILNLTATNLENSTKFIDEYSAKQTYGLVDLSPSSWDAFVKRLADDIDGEMMDQVYRFFMKSSPVSPPCNRTCRTQLINCHFKTARVQDKTFCLFE